MFSNANICCPHAFTTIPCYLMFSSLCNLDRCSVEQINILDITIQPYSISAKPFRSVDSKVWHMSSDIDDILHYILVVIYLLLLSSDFQLRSFLLRAALNNAVHCVSHKFWQEDQSELMKPGRRWEGAKRDGAKGGGGQRWQWKSRVGVAWWEKKIYILQPRESREKISSWLHHFPAMTPDMIISSPDGPPIAHVGWCWFVQDPLLLQSLLFQQNVHITHLHHVLLFEATHSLDAAARR